MIFANWTHILTEWPLVLKYAGAYTNWSCSDIKQKPLIFLYLIIKSACIRHNSRKAILTYVQR